MDAEQYLREKKRLAQALNGQENLESAMADITATLKKYSLHLMPRTAFDVVKLTLEKLHMQRFNLSDRQ